MKSPKERQHACRERRKEYKNAGLIKLKILASATPAKKLEILSEIDSIDVGTALEQAVELLWARRLARPEIPLESTAKPEKKETIKPENKTGIDIRTTSI